MDSPDPESERVGLANAERSAAMVTPILTCLFLCNSGSCVGEEDMVQSFCVESFLWRHTVFVFFLILPK